MQCLSLGNQENAGSFVKEYFKNLLKMETLHWFLRSNGLNSISKDE